MPRRNNCPPDCRVFHVLNRGIQGLVPFETSAECQAFLSLLREAGERYSVRLFAYTLMPNHWHLLLECSDGGRPSGFMHWLGTTHAQRWRAARNLRGRGAVYQGRFKSVAVATDRHFLIVCRYVERNPLRARLVARAEDWPWSSASPNAVADGRPPLAAWPIGRPEPWLDILNQPEPPSDLCEVRLCVRRGVPFGLPCDSDRDQQYPRVRNSPASMRPKALGG
jgi:putative transposase